MSPINPGEASLTDPQRAAWHALGVFSAPFDQSAALAITGADPDTLGVLVRAGLIEQDGDRFRLDDSAAGFARAALPADVLTNLHFAHARHYGAIGEEADRLYIKGGENAMTGLALFDTVRPHLEAAIAWLQTRTDAESARLLIVLADAIAHASAERFDPRQRIALLEATARAARLAGERQAEGIALSNLGNARYSMGDARRALECHEKAMAISKETGTRRSDGQDWACMGLAYAALGEHRLALMCYENQLAVVQETGDRHAEGKAWGSMGIAHTRLKDASRAIECYGKQLAIMQETADLRGEAKALGNMGHAHTALGDYSRALECHRKAMLKWQESGDRPGESQAWANMGSAHADLGHARKAVECFETRVAIARETGDQRGEANALFNSAAKLWDLNAPGERDEARRRMTAAAEIFEALEDPNAVHARERLEKWGGA